MEKNDYCIKCSEYPDGCEYCSKVEHKPSYKWWLCNDDILGD
jgi:hypothetical protein